MRNPAGPSFTTTQGIPNLGIAMVVPAAAGTGLFVLLAKLPESGTIRLIFGPNEFAMLRRNI